MACGKDHVLALVRREQESNKKANEEKDQVKRRKIDTSCFFLFCFISPEFNTFFQLILFDSDRSDP